METIKNKQIVLEELRSAYEKIFSAGDVLDGKLWNMFNFLTIVVTVAPGLELMLKPDIKQIGLSFLVLLIVMFLLYYRAFDKIIRSVAPADYRLPISVSKKELTEKYLLSPEEDVSLRTI